MNVYSESGFRNQYTHFSIQSFTDPRSPKTNYPCLKGKGGEVKTLAFAMQLVWQRLVDRPGAAHREHDNKVASCLAHLLDFTNVVDTYNDENFMTLRDADHLKSSVHAFMHDYIWLALKADARELKLFSATPKLHWLWHWAARALYLSPRRGACWGDEDLMRLFKGLAQSCAPGRQLHLVPHAMAVKYRYARSV